MTAAVLVSAAAAFLALLFAAAAWHKLADRSTFAGTLAGYALLPARAVMPVALALPWIELTTALLCALAPLFPGLAPVAGLAALALLTIYTGAIGINLAHGRFDIDCGCGGPGGGRRLGISLVLRNVLLLAVAGMLLVPGGGVQNAGVGGLMLAVVTGLLGWLLYAAADELAAAHAEVADL